MPKKRIPHPTYRASTPTRRRHAIHAARAMRTAPTPAEDMLWHALRNNQLGVRFRRQHSIDRYIVDFYCAEAALVIEVDGLTHTHPNSDAEREAELAARGLRVLRFTNDDVIHDLPAVLDRIHAARNASTSPIVKFL